MIARLACISALGLLAGGCGGGGTCIGATWGDFSLLVDSRSKDFCAAPPAGPQAVGSSAPALDCAAADDDDACAACAKRACCSEALAWMDTGAGYDDLTACLADNCADCPGFR